MGDALARYVVAPPVFKAFEDADKASRAAEGRGQRRGRSNPAIRLPVIIELNLDREGGPTAAQARVVELLGDATAADRPPINSVASSRHHVFATLTRQEIRRLVADDVAAAGREEVQPAIYKIWLDRPLEPFLDRSIRIVKADACLRSFGSDGENIVWAVADSGIQGDHAHFELYENLHPPVIGAPPARTGRPLATGSHAPLDHQDFTDEQKGALVDAFGHGTHVAGIIAGASPIAWDPPIAGPPTSRSKPLPSTPRVYRIVRERDDSDRVRNHVSECGRLIRGVAPRAKLVSLKVLDSEGQGRESSLLAAIDYVARVNDDGRWLRIHGLNLSLGYSFDAEWFAAGQSPLCVAVNRLVKQGVAVVAAAGNDGSAIIATENSPSGRRIGMDQSITDPGNAELAITVGSTHAEQPHTYGVSYFSSRGPTADGRQKPDLVAPGEKILSAASPGAIARLMESDPALGKDAAIKRPAGAAFYREESGTSMAAPHVSGAVAAFLSVRPEFIGQPERLKGILIAAATDLGRRRDFQGAGLLDLLRAIQSV
jgi:subtilisin family serine protease